MLDADDEKVLLLFMLELRKELNRRSLNVNLVFEDKRKISLENLSEEQFQVQFRISRLQLAENISSIIAKKYNVRNDKLISVQHFIDDFVKST